MMFTWLYEQSVKASKQAKQVEATMLSYSGSYSKQKRELYAVSVSMRVCMCVVAVVHWPLVSELRMYKGW